MNRAHYGENNVKLSLILNKWLNRCRLKICFSSGCHTMVISSSVVIPAIHYQYKSYIVGLRLYHLSVTIISL